jgi:hypothetical protein
VRAHVRARGLAFGQEPGARVLACFVDLFGVSALEWILLYLDLPEVTHD